MPGHEIKSAHAQAHGRDIGHGSSEEECLLEYAIFGLAQEANQQYWQTNAEKGSDQLGECEPKRLHGKPWTRRDWRAGRTHALFLSDLTVPRQQSETEYPVY